jgi:hypothetical protein
MIVINETEDSILVHSKDEVNPALISDYLRAIQSCGVQNLVEDGIEKK